MSTITYSDIGAARQPSPSIWKGFTTTRMVAHGLGYFEHEEFFNADAVATVWTGLAVAHPNYGAFALSGDADTTTSFTTDFGGVLDVETDNTDNDAYALTARPFCTTVLSSRQPWAFEARVSVDALTDQGMFLGVAESLALLPDVVADDTIETIDESQIGFFMSSANTDSIDAVFKLDAGTRTDMLADVTASSLLTATNGGAAGVLVAGTFYKLGMKFDGRSSIEIYVNGVKVSTYTITASTFPNGVEMGFVGALKTGSAALVSMGWDWIRIGYQERH